MASTSVASEKPRGRLPKIAPHPPLPPSPLGSWWPPVMGLVPPRHGRRLVLMHGLFFSLISATFAVCTLISTLLNITSLLLDLTSYSWPKLRCLSVLIANPTLFPPTVSILNFQPKAVVVHTCATMSFVLVSLIWSLPNFPPYGLGSLAILRLNSFVLFIYLLILLTILNSSTI